jgi:hypothetical protein
MGITTDICSTDDNRLDTTRPTGEKEKELVVVEWRDIIATAGWEQEISCPTLFSVGWLISQDDDTILIANTKDPDDFTGEGKSDPPIYYGLTRFPVGAVVAVHPCDPAHTCEVISPLSSQISAPKLGTHP